MSSRRKARKRALDVLYASDVRNVPLFELVEQETTRAAEEPERSASWEYAELILRGIVADSDAIDQTISEKSSWPLERMPAIDRALARIATWELRHQLETPTAVIIAEAGELAGEYSTEESRAFLQGLLGAISEVVRPSA